MNLTFPKLNRLLKSREFLKVIRFGSKRESENLVVQILAKQSQTRLGITVTKKFGKAHRRNRFKRHVREIFRLARPEIANGLWIHIRPKLAQKTDYNELQSQFFDLLHSASTKPSLPPT